MKDSGSSGSASKDAGPYFSVLKKFFTSVKTTIALLFLLALCAIVGTVVPQGEMAGGQALSGHNFANRLVIILDLNNVYRSWWFTSLLVLLSMNILGCLLKRIPLIVNEWRGIHRKSSFSLSFNDNRSIDELKSLISETLRKIMKRNPAIESSGKTLIWERQRFYLLGFPLIHVAIIVILAGGLIGLFYGYRGHVQIKVNETSSTFALLNTGEIRTLPFTIAVDAFKLTKYPTGEPKEFRSDIRLLIDSKEVLKGSILVNHPITFDGISIYQSDYRMVGISRVKLFVQKAGNEAQTLSVNPMEPVIIEGSNAEIRIRGFDPGSSQRGAGIEIVFSDKDQKPVTLRLYENDVEPARVGEFKLAFRGYEPNYATGLQIGYDPGSRVVWAGCIMLIIGFMLTLFTNIQRVQIDMTRDRNKTRITVSGRSKRMRKEFRESIESALKAALDRK